MYHSFISYQIMKAWNPAYSTRYRVITGLHFWLIFNSRICDGLYISWNCGE